MDTSPVVPVAGRIRSGARAWALLWMSVHRRLGRTLQTAGATCTTVSVGIVSNLRSEPRVCGAQLVVPRRDGGGDEPTWFGPKQGLGARKHGDEAAAAMDATLCR